MTDRRWDTLPTSADRSEAPTAKLPSLPAAEDLPRPGAESARHWTGGAGGHGAGADATTGARPPAAPPSPAAAAPRRAGRAPIKKPGPFPVIAASLGLFFVIVALLAFQMRAGADPAIGKGEPVVLAAAPTPRQVVVRRVVITRIVEHRPRRAPSAPATGTAAPAPSSAAPAPSNAAPAPSNPAPAPAPQPQAPLTTRSS